MIKDKLNKRVVEGLEFLAKTDFSKLEDGRHVINDYMYVNVETYQTKEDALFEAHRDYIDIQYIISGEEKIGVVRYSDCKENIPYDKERDIEFLNGEGVFYPMRTGDYMILYPTDAHKPSISLNEKATVRKAVVKVQV